MSLGELELTPPLATSLFILAAFAGYQYRTAWKEDGPPWKLWLFGAIAAACLLSLGFIPLRQG